MNNNPSNTFEKQIFSMTTIVFCEIYIDGIKYNTQGSAFFYNQLTPTDPSKKGAQWHKVEKKWLVTNRHVVLPKINNIETVPDNFTFCIRKQVSNGIDWVPIQISKKDLLDRLKLDNTPDIDVALIDVSTYISDIINTNIKTSEVQKLMIPSTLSNNNLPDKQPIEIDVTSDIIIASYPKGFYDDYNKFPIVKSGIVASAWGLKFRGMHLFQIDAQLFPGSSGGLVISKPTNIAMINGSLHHSKEKQFVLLGIYSGEFKWYEDLDIGGNKVKIGNSYGLGNVWYSYLIPHIIENGTSYTV